jgi:hypothetical protein
MRVADAFKSALDADFTGLTIDATALYALSAPDVPQEAPDEAVERAEDGAAGGPCRGRGVPASPQRAGCSATGAAEQSGVAALRMMIGQIHQ